MCGSPLTPAEERELYAMVSEIHIMLRKLVLQKPKVKNAVEKQIEKLRREGWCANENSYGDKKSIA